MYVRRIFSAGVVAVLGTSVLAASTGAAGTASPQTHSSPVAANGKPLQVIATGVEAPTSFAFAGSTVFVGSGEQDLGGKGGLYTVADGKATLVPNTPSLVFGLAWHSGTLYVADGPRIVMLGGWNGTTFATQKTIYTGKKGFPGFNGLAFGPEGRLYAGLTIEQHKYDHSKDPFPLSEAVVSMTAAGKGIRIVARGLRQPFQLTFPEGSRYPYVTVLGQDEGKAPRDQIVVAKSGQNYGFPTCTWMTGQHCKGFDKPWLFLPPHASPMGIGSIGKTLYVALFNGILDKQGSEVITVPTAGGKPKPFVTGFESSIIALGVNEGNIYIGELNGSIYEVGA
jgi:glucose/arabinose dehydrogenase